MSGSVSEKVGVKSESGIVPVLESKKFGHGTESSESDYKIDIYDQKLLELYDEL